MDATRKRQAPLIAKRIEDTRTVAKAIGRLPADQSIRAGLVLTKLQPAALYGSEVGSVPEASLKALRGMQVQAVAAGKVPDGVRRCGVGWLRIARA
eukprot:1292808-Alexandrium_andersonii.AAC.1